MVAGRSSDDAEPTPPEAQRWEFFLQHGVKPTCTFVRRREGAAWGPARIVVSYPGAQPALPPDPNAAPELPTTSKPGSSKPIPKGSPTPEKEKPQNN